MGLIITFKPMSTFYMAAALINLSYIENLGMLAIKPGVASMLTIVQSCPFLLLSLFLCLVGWLSAKKSVNLACFATCQRDNRGRFVTPCVCLTRHRRRENFLSRTRVTPLMMPKLEWQSTLQMHLTRRERARANSTESNLGGTQILTSTIG